jgi:hypothetical protein
LAAAAFPELIAIRFEPDAGAALPDRKVSIQAGAGR